MKKLIYSLGILALVSCGGNNSGLKDSLGILSKKATVNQEQAPEEKLFSDALSNTSEDRLHVTLEGYFQLSAVSNVRSSGQRMSFYGRKNQCNGRSMYASIPVGEDNNKMRLLPKEYYPKDVHILDNSGKKIGVNERVRATGILYSIPSYSKNTAPTVYFDIQQIEKVEEAVLDYAALQFPELTANDLDKDSNYSKEYFLEGKISIPMFVFTDTEMTVDLTDKSGKKIPIKIYTGNGNSQMETLSDNWTTKDVKIRNNKGQFIQLNKKVKVYGTLNLDGLHVEEVVQ